MKANGWLSALFTAFALISTAVQFWLLLSHLGFSFSNSLCFDVSNLSDWKTLLAQKDSSLTCIQYHSVPKILVVFPSNRSEALHLCFSTSFSATDLILWLFRLISCIVFTTPSTNLGWTWSHVALLFLNHLLINEWPLDGCISCQVGDSLAYERCVLIHENQVWRAR